MNLTEETSIVAAEDQVWCELGDEIVVLSLGDGVYFGLDSVGARIWRLLQTPCTYGDLRAACLAEYDVEAAQLEADMARLLQELAAHNLVKTNAGA